MKSLRMLVLKNLKQKYSGLMWHKHIKRDNIYGKFNHANKNGEQPPGVQIYETCQSGGQDESFSTHTLIYQHKKEKTPN